MTRLILASTSPYRRELLARLKLEFSAVAPQVDETARSGEPAQELAVRLALAKAQSVAASAPGSLVIGADQVASLRGRALGKPGSHAAALAALSACQGQSVDFHTAAAIIDAGGRVWQTVDHTRVRFASLSERVLDAYLRAEQPYDCAGGFKAEGLGVALFAAIESRDPTALIGLPLIWVAATLRAAGLEPLAAKTDRR